VLSPAANVTDAMNALKILATRPQIDANCIFHIGFSRGVGTAFYTAWPMFQRPVDTGGHVLLVTFLFSQRLATSVTVRMQM
jgi:predicted peptidase